MSWCCLAHETSFRKLVLAVSDCYSDISLYHIDITVGAWGL